MFFAVEIERWRFKVADHPVHQNIPGLQYALKLTDKDLYPNIHTIFKLLIVFQSRLYVANAHSRPCAYLRPG